MNLQTKKKLTSLFPSIRFNEPLAAHCTFRIGGPADAYIETADPRPILSALKKLKIPFIIIGGGSNILFHDKGFRGAVIRLTPRTSTSTSANVSTNPNASAIAFTKTSVTADAGTPLQTLIKKASQKGFYNLAALTGIPGTLGGAIRGNAGANGAEIKDFLIKAQIFNPKTGRTRTVTPTVLKLSYRNSALKRTNEIVLQATLKLSKATNYKTLAQKLAKKRTQTQPYGLSAGSFFKNPDPSPNKPHMKAGYLIDQCGLKGKRIGGAQISSKHANFIQNLNDPHHPATQKDVLRLAALAKKEVRRRFKITLEEEVQVIPKNNYPT
ncbi:MAG: UDP-N-acetylmuramate dehydrogenase [Candidatus Gracilibacteria bacterium]